MRKYIMQINLESLRIGGTDEYALLWDSGLSRDSDIASQAEKRNLEWREDEPEPGYIELRGNRASLIDLGQWFHDQTAGGAVSFDADEFYDLCMRPDDGSEFNEA